jgi:hypothetical protein
MQRVYHFAPVNYEQPFATPRSSAADIGLSPRTIEAVVYQEVQHQDWRVYAWCRDIQD